MENRIPDATHINSAPDPIRKYIHALEARSNHERDLQTIASQRQQLDALLTEREELMHELEKLKARCATQDAGAAAAPMETRPAIHATDYAGDPSAGGPGVIY